MAIRLGSWGTPELGITEWIGGMMGNPRTAQGGSNLIGGGTATYSNNGNTYSANPPAPQQGVSRSNTQSASVLGASKVNTGGGSGGGGQSAPQQSNGGGGGEPSINLDEIYNPIFDAYNQTEGALSQGRDAELGNLTSTEANESAKYNKEKGQLLDQNQQNQTTFEDSVKSALAEAVRYYNALQQRRGAMFGAFSSAGQALADIGNQEVARQTGNIKNQETKQLAVFANDRTKIGDYIQGKFDELGNWKKDAEAKIRSNFTAQLASLNQQRAATQAQKAQQKIAIVQDAIAQARALEQADQQFRAGLAQYTIDSMAKINGKVFTPAEVQQIYTDYGVKLGQVANAPTTASFSPQVNTAYLQNNGKDEDVVNATNPYAAA